MYPIKKKVIYKPNNTNWFKFRLEERGLSFRWVARQMKIHPSAISLLMSGKASLRAKDAAKLSILFAISVADVLKKFDIETYDTIDIFS